VTIPDRFSAGSASKSWNDHEIQLASSNGCFVPKIIRIVLPDRMNVPFLSTRRTPSDQACPLLDLVQIQQADGFESEKAEAAQRETIVFTSRPLVTDALVDFAIDPNPLACNVLF
jgi:hypothetical protein